MFHTQKKIGLIGMAVWSLGCAQSSFPSSSSVKAEGENRAGNDITVLQAWIGDSVVPARANIDNFSYPSAHRIDPDNCRTIRSNESYAEADCSRAVEQVLKLSNFAEVSPLLNQADFEWYIDANGIYPSTGMCEVLEFRTIIANEVLSQPSFSGVGFYVGGTYSGEEYYVEKNRMHKVGDVVLADGRAGAVHRFIFSGFCFGTGGNGDSIYHRQYNFKPFARFISNNQKYNIWDNVEDYVLGRTDSYAWVQSFDRQGELLKH